MTNDQRKWLANCFGNSVKFDELMSRHTSFRVGGPADAYVMPESLEKLIQLINGCRERGIRYCVIGGGTNLLVKDAGIRGVVIVLKKCLNKVTHTSTKKNKIVIQAMAGVKLPYFCTFAIRHSFEGMNFALGIPGTVGGGIMMNAGTAYGSMEDVLEAITILIPATGQIIMIKKEELKFDYRKLNIVLPISDASDQNILDNDPPVVLKGYFCLRLSDPVKLKNEAKEILKTRKRKQPVRFPSAGCFFKNPLKKDNKAETYKTAGEMIDLAGLKGMRSGGAGVSNEHANFIINHGKATADDILRLATDIQKIVFKKFNILLETEVKIVG